MTAKLIATTATASATPITTTRCPTEGPGSGGGVCGPRPSTRRQTSGGEPRSSSERNRSRMSAIVVLQERAQAPQRLREVHSHGCLAAAEHPGNLARGDVRV